MQRVGRLREKLIIGIFALILILFPVVGFFIPDRSFSDVENRVLAASPDFSFEEFMSRRYMTGFEDYVSEQFTGRDLWVEGKTAVDALMGHTDNGRVFFGKNNSLYLIDDIDRNQLNRNIAHINGFFKQVLEGYPGTDCYVMAVPSSWTVEKENLPSYAPVDNEQAVFEQLKDSVGAGVKVCNPTGALTGAFKDGVQVYYRTDHHWTADGAYAAYVEWAKTVGVKAASQDEFDISVVNNDFYGMADSKGRLPWAKPDAVKAYLRKAGPTPRISGESISSGGTLLDGLYDYSYLDVKNKYNFYMGGNYSAARVETGVQNGRTLLIVRDSFANCFVPLLTGHFERIILVDLRYYKAELGDFFEEEGVDSVMLLFSAVQLANDRNMYGLKL